MSPHITIENGFEVIPQSDLQIFASHAAACCEAQMMYRDDTSRVAYLRLATNSQLAARNAARIAMHCRFELIRQSKGE